MTCAFIADVCKTPTEVRQYTLDLTQRVSRFWEAGTIYSEETRVRPSTPDGFEYEAGNDGQTGRVEPKWRATTKDGSITWTREAIGNASLMKTIAGVTWDVPSPLTQDGTGLTMIGGRQTISIRLSGGVDGTIYLVTALVEFSDGTEEKFGFRVSVEAPA